MLLFGVYMIEVFREICFAEQAWHLDSAFTNKSGTGLGGVCVNQSHKFNAQAEMTGSYKLLSWRVQKRVKVAKKKRGNKHGDSLNEFASNTSQTICFIEAYNTSVEEYLKNLIRA